MESRRRKVDEAKKLERVEQVRLEVEASHARAAECIAQNLAKKKLTAARMKVEISKALKKTRKRQRLLSSGIVEWPQKFERLGMPNPQVAVKRVHEANKKKRTAIKIDIADRIARKREEDPIEQERWERSD